MSLQSDLQRLTGSTLDAQGCSNLWIGRTRAEGWLDLVGALNVKAGTTGLELQGVLNELAGTTGLGVDAAAALITGGRFELLTESGDALYTESGDSLTQEH